MPHPPEFAPHAAPDFTQALAASNQVPAVAPSPQVIPLDTIAAPFQASPISPARMDFMRATSMQMLQNGASPEEAVRWMEIESQKTANLAPPVVMPGETAPDPVGMINGLSKKVLSGLTWGFADEILGGISGIFARGITRQEGIDQYRD